MLATWDQNLDSPIGTQIFYLEENLCFDQRSLNVVPVVSCPLYLPATCSYMHLYIIFKGYSVIPTQAQYALCDFENGPQTQA